MTPFQVFRDFSELDIRNKVELSLQSSSAYELLIIFVNIDYFFSFQC